MSPGSEETRPAEIEASLEPTWFIDSETPAIREYAKNAVGDATTPVLRACRLFYAVRDDIRYSAYGIGFDRESFRASNVLASGRGWCVNKSCLLAAVSRAVGVPCRLGFANVRNHMATKKLLERMGTDVFYYHGYNEFFLEDRWVKATVAFNLSLCEKARLKPLEFDGRTDALYHPFDLQGRRHMEYLHDYGPFVDLPLADILKKFAEVYEHLGDHDTRQSELSGDFEAEIAAEADATAREEPG